MKPIKYFICLFIFVLIKFNVYGALAEVNPKTTSTWDSYYQNTINASSPWKTLRIANQLFQDEGRTGGHAADLGAGTGRDTLFLLKEGWHVLAIDAEQQAIDILLNRAEPELLEQLDVMAATFSSMILPENLDLINASYSLPFCHPSDFPSCWKNIVDHLSVGGRFSGQFFGEEDAWAISPDMTFLSDEKFKELFKDRFVIEYLHIEKGQKPCGNGEMKFWHIYNVVARKVN